MIKNIIRKLIKSIPDRTDRDLAANDLASAKFLILNTATILIKHNIATDLDILKLRNQLDSYIDKLDK